MFRTRTAVLVGSGAGYELDLPEDRELLGRIAQGFDFGRLGSDLQTPDMVALNAHFERVAARQDIPVDSLRQAGGAIRRAARMGTSIGAVLDQLGHDRAVLEAGRLAIVHYILQAEARSPLGSEPRDPGDLPLRGNENWLFQLSRLLVSGASPTQLEESLGNLTVVNFGYDRAFEHYVPFAISMAAGIDLGEARALVTEKLTVLYPLGRAGRLPWAAGEQPCADWGDEEEADPTLVAGQIARLADLQDDPDETARLRAALVGAQRIVSLGFGFEPGWTGLLFGAEPPGAQEICGCLPGSSPETRGAIGALLERMTGLGRDAVQELSDQRPFEFLRANALFLES